MPNVIRSHLAWCRRFPRTALAFWMTYCIILGSGTRKLTDANILHSDYDGIRNASWNLIHGEDIYQDQTRPRDGEPAHRRYIYFPLLAILFVPLVPLGLQWGFVAWWVIDAALILWIVHRVRGILATTGLAPAWLNLATWVPLLVSSGYFRVNLHEGNVNFLILAVILEGLKSCLERRGWLSGFLFGFATVAKVTPGLFLIYLLIRRKWRAVAGFLLSAALFSQGLGTLIFGWNQSFEIHLRQTKMFLGAADSNTWWMKEFRTTRINQSLSAAVRRFTSPVPALDGRRPPVTVNLVDWPPGRIQGFVRILSMAVLLISLAVTAWPLRARPPESVILDFAVLCLTILLITPVTWNSHFVIILFPFAAALMLLGSKSEMGPERKVLLIATILAVALTFSTRRAVTGKTLSKMMGAYSANCFSAILLWAALVFARLKRHRTPAQAVPGDQGEG